MRLRRSLYRSRCLPPPWSFAKYNTYESCLNLIHRWDRLIGLRFPLLFALGYNTYGSFLEVINCWDRFNVSSSFWCINRQNYRRCMKSFRFYGISHHELNGNDQIYLLILLQLGLIVIPLDHLSDHSYCIVTALGDQLYSMIYSFWN